MTTGFEQAATREQVRTLSVAAIGTAPGKNGDDVDGFGDQGTRDGNDGFLDELLKPAQGAKRGAGATLRSA